MDFTSDKPIYRQIIDFSFGQILTGAWTAGERVPSVRELSVQLSVNSHTVLKAYEYLQAEGIIVSRRGMGFYLTADALEQVNQARRREFLTRLSPASSERWNCSAFPLTKWSANTTAVHRAPLKSSQPNRHKPAGNH